MSFKKWLTRLAVTVAYSAQAARSDDQAIAYLMSLELEELMQVKIATGVKQPIANAPSITTVVTVQDIEATGATNLEEALESVPGLHISRVFFGYEPRYIIRGISSMKNPEIL